MSVGDNDLIFDNMIFGSLLLIGKLLLVLGFTRPSGLTGERPRAKDCLYFAPKKN